MVMYKDNNTGLLRYMELKHPEFFRKKLTRQEMLDAMLALQSELIKQLPQNNCNIDRITDITDIINCMAKRKNLLDNAKIKNRISEISLLFESVQRGISTTIAGINGERRVFNELKLIDSMDIEIIPNVAMSVGSFCCEIDFVVITNYGIYCIEVKNPLSDMVLDRRGYLVPKKFVDPIRGKKNNVLHQSRVQQHVIKQFIGADKVVTPLLVCGNWEAEIVQQYDAAYLETLGLVDLAERIYKDSKNGEILYTETEIGNMARIIRESQIELLIPMEVNIADILEKYEFLLKSVIYSEGNKSEERDSVCDITYEECAEHQNENYSDDYIEDEEYEEEEYEEESDINDGLKIAGIAAAGVILVAGIACFAGLLPTDKTAKTLLKLI